MNELLEIHESQGPCDDPEHCPLAEAIRKCDEAITAQKRQSEELIQLVENLLFLAQGTRIREVRAMAEAKWQKHYRDAAQE